MIIMGFKGLVLWLHRKIYIIYLIIYDYTVTLVGRFHCIFLSLSLSLSLTYSLTLSLTLVPFINIDLGVGDNIGNGNSIDDDDDDDGWMNGMA